MEYHHFFFLSSYFWYIFDKHMGAMVIIFKYIACENASKKKSNLSEFNYWSRFNAAVWGLRVGHKVPSRDGGTLEKRELVCLLVIKTTLVQHSLPIAPESNSERDSDRFHPVVPLSHTISMNLRFPPPPLPLFYSTGKPFRALAKSTCLLRVKYGRKKKECVCFDAWSRANGSSYREKRKRLVLFIRSSVHACYVFSFFLERKKK